MLTEIDADKIRTFHYALMEECSKKNVAFRELGNKEYGDEQYIWMVSYHWQIHNRQYELFINVSETNEEFRYGHKEVL